MRNEELENVSVRDWRGRVESLRQRCKLEAGPFFRGHHGGGLVRKGFERYRGHYPSVVGGESLPCLLRGRSNGTRAVGSVQEVFLKRVKSKITKFMTDVRKVTSAVGKSVTTDITSYFYQSASVKSTGGESLPRLFPPLVESGA